MDFLDKPFSYQVSFPFTCVITGSSGSGKTFTIFDIIKNRKKYFKEELNVVYCYGMWQENFKTFQIENPEVVFVESIWEIDENLKKGEKTIVLLDDKISDLEFDPKQNRYVRDLFTKRSRHENLGVIVTTQVAFPSKFRAISLNAKYLIFFSNKRDKSFINLVNRQFCPEVKGWLYNALKEATKNNPYGSITLDMNPQCPEVLNVRSHLYIDTQNPNFQIYYVSCTSF